MLVSLKNCAQVVSFIEVYNVRSPLWASLILSQTSTLLNKFMLSRVYLKEVNFETLSMHKKQVLIIKKIYLCQMQGATTYFTEA